MVAILGDPSTSQREAGLRRVLHVGVWAPALAGYKGSYRTCPLTTHLTPFENTPTGDAASKPSLLEPRITGEPPTCPGRLALSQGLDPKFKLLVSKQHPSAQHSQVTGMVRDRAALTFSKAAKSTWAWPVTSTTVRERGGVRGGLSPSSAPLPELLLPPSWCFPRLSAGDPQT